jgi:hypothetical protein
MKDYDTINLAVVQATFDTLTLLDALKSHYRKTGNLLYFRSHKLRPEFMIGRIVPHCFNYSIVQKWLSYCFCHHTELCSQKSSIGLSKIIDCKNRAIVSASQNIQYLTLSYVWGQPKVNDLDKST